MTRSTVQPQPIKLWRVLEGELDVTATWDAHQITVTDEMNGDRQEWEYESLRFRVPYDGPPDRADAYVIGSETLILALAKARSNVVTADDVDRETEATINTAMSEQAPVGEQLGILREMLVQVLNTLGLESTAEFAKLNETAIAAIEDGRAKKEAL